MELGVEAIENCAPVRTVSAMSLPSCVVCLEDYSGTLRPRCLPCGHSLCTECLALVSSCVECRHPLHLKSLIPINYALEEALLSCSASTSTTSTPPKPSTSDPQTPTACLCDECEAKHSSVYCDECDFLYCEQCDWSTHFPKALRDHRRSPCSSRAAAVSQKCAIHPLEFISMVSGSLRAPVCKQCIEEAEPQRLYSLQEAQTLLTDPMIDDVNSLLFTLAMQLDTLEVLQTRSSSFSSNAGFLLDAALGAVLNLQKCVEQEIEGRKTVCGVLCTGIGELREEVEPRKFWAGVVPKLANSVKEAEAVCSSIAQVDEGIQAVDRIVTALSEVVEEMKTCHRQLKSKVMATRVDNM